MQAQHLQSIDKSSGHPHLRSCIISKVYITAGGSTKLGQCFKGTSLIQQYLTFPRENLKMCPYSSLLAMR